MYLFQPGFAMRWAKGPIGQGPVCDRCRGKHKMQASVGNGPGGVNSELGSGRNAGTILAMACNHTHHTLPATKSQWANWWHPSQIAAGLWLRTLWLRTIWLRTLWLRTLWLRTLWLRSLWLGTIWLRTLCIEKPMACNAAVLFWVAVPVARARPPTPQEVDFRPNSPTQPYTKII